MAHFHFWADFLLQFGQELMESYKNQNLYVLSKKSSRPRGGAVLYLSKKIYVKVFELFFTSVNLQWRKKKKKMAQNQKAISWGSKS